MSRLSLLSSRSGFALALAVPAIVWTACSSGVPSDEPPPLPVPERIVLITVDTLRADHLSSFGYPLPTSPWIDSVIERGVVFRRAYAQSATTKPSHASLFTSLYPLEHGVLKNGQVLATGFLTLAELMRDAGYRTAAFVSTDVPLSGNIEQGFEHWDPPRWEDPDAPHSLYRPAEATLDRALEWLRREVSPTDRLFLWVHVYDPHNPLQPPEAMREAIAGAARELGREAHLEVLDLQGIPATRPAAYAKILDYDAEILYADSQLARLESYFESRGLADAMLWIVTADHGQGLGAHGFFGHSVQIYNAQLHVPLVFRFSGGGIEPRSVDDQVVELVDVLPTLSEIVGADATRQILPLRGRSLAPWLRGLAMPRSSTAAFAQRSEYVDPSTNRLNRRNYEPGSRYALQDLDHKYLLFTEGADELYDLRLDPHEKVDRIADPAYADTAARLEAAIQRLVESSVQEREVLEVSEEDMERLQALGYLQ